jgi:hypothetical protein
MDSKNLKGLMEAYSEIYAPQEVDEATAMAKRGYDETKLRKRAAGGEAADRATSLENRPTYGDKSKEAQRSRYARAQRGDFRNTASSNPGLHVGQHKSDDPKVKAKQAARGAQRGALTPNERKQLNMGDETFDLFDTVLEFLQAEGYAETLEEAEWMMANVIDEEAIGIILGEASYSAKAARAGKDIGKPGKAFAKIAKEAGKRYGSKERGEKVAGAVLAKLRREEIEIIEDALDEAIYSEKGKAKAAEMIAKRSTPSGRAKSGKGANVAHIRQIRGSGRGDFDREGLGGTPMTPTMAKNPIKKQNYVGTGNKAARRAGLTPTREKPNAWKEEYVDEAQHARENPEKYEREQSKKSAPVRGEKTPMPPRGNKKREDFEKWYAANVR